mgnify:CR=1 FL=1
MDKQQFFNGAVFDAWRWFGAHLGGGGAVFRTFAPNASRITLTGAMNGWTATDLHQDGRSGFWEVSVPGTQAGQLYKYRIYAADGSVTEHCDPYGFAMELRPACCSIVTDLEEYRFTDDAWMQARSADPDAPLNIYEMHLGSWQRNPEDANGWFTYEQLADRLIPYLLDGGYTHVEFLPLSEHPFDGSWGYQNTGFFAPTSRYGTPAQLRLLIDRLHHAGIGAIMDFIEASTGRRPDLIVGKPNTGIVEAAVRRTHIAPAQMAMVGDRLYTDIETGIRSGMLSVLVMSGETTREMLASSATRPDYTFDRLCDMNPLL